MFEVGIVLAIFQEFLVVRLEQGVARSELSERIGPIGCVEVETHPAGVSPRTKRDMATDVDWNMCRCNQVVHA